MGTAIAIVGVAVLPMDGQGSLADQTVLLQGDRIVRVAPRSEVDTTGSTVIDGTGKWLVPGLSDMHVHLHREADLSLFLLNGVTTVRNLFGSPYTLAWRERIAAGTLDGPTLITAGPIIDGSPPFWPNSAVVTGAEDARAAVVAQNRAGYDWIKVYVGLTSESYRAVIAEAAVQGMPVAGHTPKNVGLENVIASTQRSIEHLDGYVSLFGPTRTDDAIVAMTAADDVWNCPTLVVSDRFSHLDHVASLNGVAGLEYVPAEIIRSWDPRNDSRFAFWTDATFEEARRRNGLRRDLVGRLAKAGARLVLGTDTGNPYVIPGFAVHDELALLVASGVAPFDALRMATAAPAEMVGTPREFGVISAGGRADLLLVAGDPRADLRMLAEPEVVVVRGEVHRRADLLAAARASTPMVR